MPDIELKECSACHELKPHTAFVRSPRHRDGYHGVCKSCRNKQRQARGRSETRQQRRKYALKRDFGITPEQYASLLIEQNGVCAICGATPDNSYHGVLHVDHNHKTGELRGLLCSSCNMGIGQLGDSPERLRAAADYLDAGY